MWEVSSRYRAGERKAPLAQLETSCRLFIASTARRTKATPPVNLNAISFLRSHRNDTVYRQVGHFCKLCGTDGNYIKSSLHRGTVNSYIFQPLLIHEMIELKKKTNWSSYLMEQKWMLWNTWKYPIYEVQLFDWQGCGTYVFDWLGIIAYIVD